MPEKEHTKPLQKWIEDVDKIRMNATDIDVKVAAWIASGGFHFGACHYYWPEDEEYSNIKTKLTLEEALCIMVKKTGINLAQYTCLEEQLQPKELKMWRKLDSTMDQLSTGTLYKNWDGQVVAADEEILKEFERRQKMMPELCYECTRIGLDIIANMKEENFTWMDRL